MEKMLIGSKICPICKKEFTKKPKQKPSAFKKQICCSVKCKGKWCSKDQVGKKAHNNIQTKSECIVCGKVIIINPNRPKLTCSKECLSKFCKDRIQGDKHFNWQGGITLKNRKKTYGLTAYNNWRTAVYTRDNFTCVKCGGNKSGTLNAHHIKPVSKYPDPKDVLDVNNGITLCVSCHKKEHKKRCMK